MLPPSDSFKIRVSFESRYGMNLPRLLLSLRMFMQLPSASKDRLMFAPSTILWPRLSLLAARSLPAKSIKQSLDEILCLLLKAVILVGIELVGELRANGLKTGSLLLRPSRGSGCLDQLIDLLKLRMLFRILADSGFGLLSMGLQPPLSSGLSPEGLVHVHCKSQDKRVLM